MRKRNPLMLVPAALIFAGCLWFGFPILGWLAVAAAVIGGGAALWAWWAWGGSPWQK